jgi:hypothetical protein
MQDDASGGRQCELRIRDSAAFKYARQISKKLSKKPTTKSILKVLQQYDGLIKWLIIVITTDNAGNNIALRRYLINKLKALHAV